MQPITKDDCEVSIIIPIYNGSKWIDKCFECITKQTALNIIQFEVCVCNDASTDNTEDLLNLWKERLKCCNVKLNVYNNNTGQPKGVGFAKNKAVMISKGNFLCFQDVDDVMLPERILVQYQKALELQPNTLIGSSFKRVPADSTVRYTKWANSLSQQQLILQIYTANGPTIIMPTWFCHKSAFENVGGFVEDGKGTPEDLIFFYKHLDLNGTIYKLENVLVDYYYHPEATSFSIHENTIWNIRMERLQRVVLSKWESFTIWNAGKQGRQFYNSLSEENKNKVLAFCDVDTKKIGKKYVPFNPVSRQEGCPIDIVNFHYAKKPFIVCVKLDMTKGQLEQHLASLKIKEGTDYIVFS